MLSEHVPSLVAYLVVNKYTRPDLERILEGTSPLLVGASEFKEALYAAAQQVLAVLTLTHE